MAIIADPQLTDWMSYRQSGLLLALVETYTDIYMKRSFRRLHASLRPDAVLFLGDLNDGGRNSNQKTFEKNTNRFFEWVFATKTSAWNQDPIVMDGSESETATEEREAATEVVNNSHGLRKRQTLTDEEKAVNVDITGHYLQRIEAPLDATERQKIRDSGRSLRLYVAGNHDVGFGDTIIRSSMRRYKRVFGSVNYEVNVGNHSLVVLDTLALSADVPSIREESQQLLDQIKQEQLSLPRILFTHVPLHRLDTTYCGKTRETERTIKDSGGEQYQNMVNTTLSREILKSIQPDMVFSGDDHDWCEIAHPTIGGNFVPEVTVRTVSFAQGIQQPAFVMMSLFNPDHKPKNIQPVVPLDFGLPVSDGSVQGTVQRPSGDTTFVYDECMLPRQLLIYTCYGALFAFSLSWILIRQFQWMSSYRKWAGESSILSRWHKSQSVDITRTTSNNTISESSIGSSSSRAYQQIDDSTFEEQNSYYDEPVEPLWLGAINSGEKQWRKRSPIFMGLFWKRVARDLWDVIQYVVPFYMFLFVCSII
ncbi:hypothetical protein BGZ96_008540 [Linnemannia gamsii]|uniref:Calcineurin-like phosphoesterase domain-containing protein n=1 Tax=Linnemannia gamsii TaxID=64522 RepID=A0ABQ7JYD2_9FUNG|nr:hypothetical protein BGZ96_008540 [Linnemannia gamsii]